MQSTFAKTLVDNQSGLKFANSPTWVGSKLLFLDIHDRCIKSADLHGTVRRVTDLPYLPASLGVLANGELVAGDAWRRKLCLLASAGPEEMADLSNIAGCCLSNGIAAGRAGIYVGDVGFNYLDPLVNPVADGVIIHVSAKGEPSVVAEDLFSPSGMIVTPDCRTLIVAETLAHKLTAFGIKKDGSLGNRRVWARFQDDVRPEGVCLDRAGAIWAAGAGPWALHVREGGEIDHRISTVRPVYATTLGGPERRHLFMCTSGSSDPVITRRAADATIDIAEVETPGA